MIDDAIDSFWCLADEWDGISRMLRRPGLLCSVPLACLWRRRRS